MCTAVPTINCGKERWCGKTPHQILDLRFMIADLKNQKSRIFSYFNPLRIFCGFLMPFVGTVAKNYTKKPVTILVMRKNTGRSGDVYGQK